MAEAIAIYFHSQRSDAVLAALTGMGELVGENLYIPTNADYEIILMPYDEWDAEIEDEWVTIEQLLKGPITGAVIIELRRSVQNLACERARVVLRRILEREDAVVDDGIGCIATLSAALDGTRLMAGYRHPG